MTLIINNGNIVEFLIFQKVKILFFVRHCQNLRIFSYVTDFDKYHLSKQNVKLILKILSDLEPLRGSSNKKTL
jgi:hypothetical protein